MQALDSHTRICKTCKTPTESIIEVMGKKFKVPVMCKCEEKKWDEMKRQEEIKARIQ
jgi:DNA-binding HxlR family transcriptional regulator